MNSKIFNKKLPHSCEYCKYGKLSEFSNQVLCLKHGVTERRDSCRKYKYDALKRIPKRISVEGNYKPEDFSI